jgi:predicted nucleotide-binding protein (sugar kinase/HSP70/actin superfamily)
MRRGFSSAAGESVARGAGEGRLIPVGAKVLGKHPAQRACQIHPFGCAPQTAQAGSVGGHKRRSFLVAQ